MAGRSLRGIFLAAVGTFGLFVLLSLENAAAVPSFGRQTGMSCSACHTLFPELTPFGRTFKLGGYVLSKSGKPYEFPPPISAAAQVSFTETERRQPPGSTESNWATHFLSTRNGNVGLPQMLSLYYAGRIFDKVGTFLQGTFDGPSNDFLLDHTDLRYANDAAVLGKTLTYGLTLNNNPTAQDVWNSTPAYSFPYVTSGVAPTPAAAAIIDNSLALQVAGLGLYGFWNDLIYGEATLYRTNKSGITKPLGAGTETEMVVDDVAPYWRLAVQHQWKDHSISAGTYGMVVDIFPEGRSHGSTDRFTDVALDVQYQYITNVHIFSLQTTWVHEWQDRDASFRLGDTARGSDRLDTFRVNGNYYYRSKIGTFGATLAYFSTMGSKDSLLYSSAPLDGSRTGRPGSNGFILEADYLLWERLKFSLQYTAYGEFNGASSNYDGFGRDASDNNTFFFLLWLLL